MSSDTDADDSFLQDLLARAKERDIKLAKMEKVAEDVSYPPLSPLPEENLSREYSTDLSIECDEIDDLHRAEFREVIESSPEQEQHYRVSPRLDRPSTPKSLQNITPLQERQPEQKVSTQSLPISPDEQTIKDLGLKIDAACQKRSQLEKAVEASKYGSIEHVEAARLLQITSLMHLNFDTYLSKFKKGDIKNSESLGSIKISNIRLKISTKLRNDLADDNVSHYFFCIACCGTEVKATKMMTTDDIRKQDLKAYILFKDNIAFKDLPPDFVVKLEVYELVIGQHLPKLLSRLTPSKKTKITPESRFRRVGSLRLMLDDKDTCSKNMTQFGKKEESKYIERECKYQVELKPEQLPFKAGMLHVRTLDNEGRPDWSRFWIDLSSGEIRFWKSKQDALDGKKPNQVLEFNDICSDKVQKLTPDDDLYRQNSFVLYSKQLMAGGEKDTLFQRILKEDRKFKIVKHQLAADNREDRDSWCGVLDRAMHCYREWYGQTKIYSNDQVKEIFSTI